MTEKELIQWCKEQLEHYRRTVSPEEAIQRLIDKKIINEKGEVLITRAEKEAGHPIDDADNGTAK